VVWSEGSKSSLIVQFFRVFWEAAMYLHCPQIWPEDMYFVSLRLDDLFKNVYTMGYALPIS